MKIRLTKQFSFEMAHALTGYDGHCRNIHGHSYKLFVTVEGTPSTDAHSPKQGMVMDFGDLKATVNRLIISPFDHALVLPHNSPYNVGLETKTILVDFQPTCENLLIHFASLLEGKLHPTATLDSLRMYETDSSYAELFL